jgi:hypothetical protein
MYERPENSSSSKAVVKGEHLMIQGCTGPDLWLPHGVALDSFCFWYLGRTLIYAQGKVRVGRIVFESQGEAVHAIQGFGKRGYKEHLMKAI